MKGISFYSTTAKKNSKKSELPNKNINKLDRKNYLFATKEEANDYIKRTKHSIRDILFVDIEKKRDFNLFEVFKSTINNKILPYKPNDITLEAADLLILVENNYEITDKNIVIFGAGNIGTKLAIRLAERNSNVFIWDKNPKKLKEIILGINHILPKGSNKIKKFNKKQKYQIGVSFIGAEKIIDLEYTDYFENESLIIDGGIGNYTEEFIDVSNKKNSKVIRLDVRIGNRNLEVHVNNYLHGVPLDIGRCQKDKYSYVAGGMIGKRGELIVDSLVNPKVILGVANGYGGIIAPNQMTELEKERINLLNEYISDNYKAGN